MSIQEFAAIKLDIQKMSPRNRALLQLEAEKKLRNNRGDVAKLRFIIFNCKQLNDNADGRLAMAEENMVRAFKAIGININAV